MQLHPYIVCVSFKKDQLCPVSECHFGKIVFVANISSLGPLQIEDFQVYATGNRSVETDLWMLNVVKNFNVIFFFRLIVTDAELALCVRGCGLVYVRVCVVLYV